MKKDVKHDVSSSVEENRSFLEKMKSDKKYNAKVQLIVYGVFIVILIIYVNISSMGGSVSKGNSLLNNFIENDKFQNTTKDQKSLLEQVEDNFCFDVVVEIKKKNEEKDEDHKIRFVGKSYNNTQEISKESGNDNFYYYKLDERYYNKDEEISLIAEDVVYDLIDGEYIEINSILKLLDKASLDHVTDYSSGKKEYVYHLKVRDIIVSYQDDELIEIKAQEENNTLTINVDYTKLLKVVDDSILECQLDAVITEIGEVEEFFVFDNNVDQNTSIE